MSIRALALAGTSDFGVLRLVVDDGDKAREALGLGGAALDGNGVSVVEEKEVYAP